VSDSRDVFASVISTLVAWLPLALWCAWWLLCVDWKKLRPVLSTGAWTAVVLLALVSGVVWARLDPRDLTWPGFYLPALTWRVASAVGLALLAMLCGWLQGVIGWMPPEFAVHPPEPAHGHAHGDAHGHH
jgi:hypothetical protein